MGTKLFSLTFGLVAKLLKKLQLAGFTGEDVELLKKRADDVLAFLREGTTPQEDRGMSTELQIKRWVTLYREIGIELDPATIKLPKRPHGKDRLIVVSPGLSYTKLIQLFRNMFSIFLYIEDLDKNVIDCCKARDCPYGIWVRDCREVEEENRNKSADQFAQEKCETLMERLLHEWAYFSETGQYLNENSWTTCAGSRYLDDGVPCVSWGRGARRLHVGWFDSGYRDSRGGVRSAVR